MSGPKRVDQMLGSRSVAGFGMAEGASGKGVGGASLVGNQDAGLVVGRLEPGL